MRYIKVDIKDISFQYTPYRQSLYDSILRIGFSFPIHVRVEDNEYICIDGNKRLSALVDILKEYPDYKRGTEVCILIKDGINDRSNDCWRSRNHH